MGDRFRRAVSDEYPGIRSGLRNLISGAESDEFRHAMPVIVPPDKYDVWLDPDVNDFNVIRDILRPYDANLMRRYPVSRKLNNAKINGAESASPVIVDTPAQAKLF